MDWWVDRVDWSVLVSHVGGCVDRAGNWDVIEGVVT